MSQYLVVAHQTAASPELIGRLKEIATSDPRAEFVLLVPATASRHLLTWVEGDKDEIARQRAADAATAMREAGLSVATVIVGAADPLRAIEREHRQGGRQYALTIISMLPPGLSRWFHRDLPHLVESRLGVPVMPVQAGHRSLTPMAEAMSEAGPELATDSQAMSLRELTGWQSRELLSADGPVGQVNGILYDYVARSPLWVSIASHPLPFRTILVPARALYAEGGRLRTALPRQQILSQPHVTVGEGFSSLTEEEQICRHFGLPFDELRDTRVLRPGQEIPGQEQNEQHILASERLRSG